MKQWLPIALVASVLVPPAAAAQIESTREPVVRRHHEGARIRVGRSYHLPADAVAEGPIVVIGGSATIDGRAEDDVVVVGGALMLGPTAEVRGDISVFGGEAYIDPRARTAGRLNEAAIDLPDVRFTPWDVGLSWLAAAAFAATLVRLFFTLVIGLIAALLAPGWLRAISGRAALSPGVCGLLGLAVEVLFWPAVVLTGFALLISIIGIPLLAALPFAVVGFGIVWAIGFTGVAVLIGSRIRTVRGATSESPALDVVIGTFALSGATLVGHLLSLGPGLLMPAAFAFGLAGLTIEYLAWTVGLGAVLRAPLGGEPKPWTPPPVPTPAGAPATF